jgi:hypothetical protein
MYDLQHTYMSTVLAWLRFTPRRACKFITVVLCVITLVN